MKYHLLFILLIALLCLTAVVSIALGRYPLSLYDIVSSITNEILGSRKTAGLIQFFNCTPIDESKISVIRNIVLDIRLPRIIAAMLVGSALSVSGAAFQSIFINPLVSPGLLGVLAGASFGAALGILFSASWIVVQASAFLFGFIAVAVSLCIAKFYKGDQILMLILGGIISGSLFTALLSTLKYIADPYDALPSIVYWLMGGLSMTDSKSVLIVSFPILGGVAGLMILSLQINVLSMGDEEAKSLGVNVGLIRFVIIFLSTLVSSLTVALGGVIGWVGLIIPHIARMVVGPDNRILLPAAAIIGAVYLLIVDDISRLLFSVEIPLGILTSLVGIPFFAAVLGKTGKGWH